MYLNQYDSNNDMHDAEIKGMFQSGGKFHLDFMGVIQISEVFLVQTYEIFQEVHHGFC